MPSLNHYNRQHDLPASAEARSCPCFSRTPLSVRFGLRSGTRPIFEGRWGCRPACVQAAIAAAVRREWGRSVGGSTHRHRVPIGLVLLSKGAVTPAQLKHALLLQKGEGGRIGEILIRHCSIPESAVTEALSTQWNCPVWAVRGFDPSRMARLAPREVLQDAGLVPLRNVGGERLYVTSSRGLDAGTALALERMHKVSVEFGISSDTDLSEAQTRLSAATYVATEYESYVHEADLVRSVEKQISRTEPIESRLVRVHNHFWLRMWLEASALTSSMSEDIQDVLFTRVGGTA